MHVTVAIGCVFNGLQLLPSLAAQIGGSIAFAVWRGFLFSIISAYNMDTFGPGTMGRIMGLCFLGAAVVNLVQLPAVQWSLGALNGDFGPLLIGSFVASLPLPVIWIFVQCRAKPETQFEQLGGALEPQTKEVPASAGMHTRRGSALLRPSMATLSA